MTENHARADDTLRTDECTLRFSQSLPQDSQIDFHGSYQLRASYQGRRQVINQAIVHAISEIVRGSRAGGIDEVARDRAYDSAFGRSTSASDDDAVVVGLNPDSTQFEQRPAKAAAHTATATGRKGCDSLARPECVYVPNVSLGPQQSSASTATQQPYARGDPLPSPPSSQKQTSARSDACTEEATSPWRDRSVAPTSPTAQRESTTPSHVEQAQRMLFQAITSGGKRFCQNGQLRRSWNAEVESSNVDPSLPMLQRYQAFDQKSDMATLGSRRFRLAACFMQSASTTSKCRDASAAGPVPSKERSKRKRERIVADLLVCVLNNLAPSLGAHAYLVCTALLAAPEWFSFGHRSLCKLRREDINCCADNLSRMLSEEAAFVLDSDQHVSERELHRKPAAERHALPKSNAEWLLIDLGYAFDPCQVIESGDLTYAQAREKLQLRAPDIRGSPHCQPSLGGSSAACSSRASSCHSTPALSASPGMGTSCSGSSLTVSGDGPHDVTMMSDAGDSVIVDFQCSNAPENRADEDWDALVENVYDEFGESTTRTGGPMMFR